MLARGSEELASRFIPQSGEGDRASY
jgi:hypothetical protein